MGGSGKGGSPNKTYEKGLYNIGQGLYDQTQGYRDYWGQTFQDASRGKVDWGNTGYGAARDALEGQYTAGREQVLEATPVGGGQTAALASLSRDRAQNVGALKAKIIEDILAKGYGAGYGAPQTSISGLGSAADAYSQRYAAQQASGGAKGQALGMAGGMAAQGYLSK